MVDSESDEKKIGFFGVGFYSLFSIAEEPFVTSGDQCMAFLWNGDQLMSKTGPCPTSPWTTFYLQLREKLDLPDMDEFARFLVTSLCFTEKLNSVVVFHDEKQVFQVKKVVSDPQPLDARHLLPALVKSTPKQLFSSKISANRIWKNCLGKRKMRMNNARIQKEYHRR